MLILDGRFTLKKQMWDDKLESGISDFTDYWLRVALLEQLDAFDFVLP